MTLRKVALCLALGLAVSAPSVRAGITRMGEMPITTSATGTVKANGTERVGGYPAYYYHSGTGMDVERDPRQWAMSGYGGYSPMMYGMGSGSEMLLTCLLVVLGIGVIGLPFLLLIFSAFTGGNGVNFIPPTTTTTVAGRKRRDILDQLFPGSNTDKENLLNIFENFVKASDKLDYLKKLIDTTTE